MTPERYQRVVELFHAALELKPEARPAFLAQACTGDEDLRQEVEAMLAADAKSGGFLDEPADDLAASAMRAGGDRSLIGRRFLSYEVVALLGAGGMGEVYRARDSKLKREVAIKVLPATFANDPERMSRFQREAQVLASLNHPNIAAIYGLEEWNGLRALVMELVEGPTLAERIGGRAMPMEQALPIAKQIAEALDYAHAKGIIHRDLKPANVKLTGEGNVKVLDFGLAKALEKPAPVAGDPSISPTFTLEGTREGVILGTAAYMAPEQARGAALDKRADIWSFGVVLYEMLTGKRPFAGATVSDTLAAVLKSEPDLSRVPPQAQRLMRRCLDKDPKRRLRDIGEAQYLLEESPPQAALAPGRARRLWLAWSVALVATLGLAIVAFLHFREKPHAPAAQVARLTMDLAPAKWLTRDFFDRPSRTAIAIAPDGNTVVFSALNPGTSGASGNELPPFKLYRRALNQIESVAIPGTEGAIGPFFSPDGQWVGFWAYGKLEKVAISGGPAFTICDAPTQTTLGLWGASWSSTDMIVFAVPLGDLMQVPAKGGTPQILIKHDPAKAELYSTPEFLPDGKTLLYTVRTSENWGEAQIVALRLDSREQRVLIQGGTDARYVPTGHLLYMQNAVLMAVPFDARRMQLAGPSVALLDGVMQAVNSPNFYNETGMGQFAASASGNLIYAAGGIYPPSEKTLLLVDRNGKEAELRAPRGVYNVQRVSPDGRKLAVDKQSETSRLADIWVLDLLTGNGTRLTSQGSNYFPLWSPDGKRLLFSGGPGKTQILSIAADGSSAAEPVLTSKNGRVVPASWSTDGKLAYLASDERLGWRIWTRSMSGDGAPEPFSDSKFNFWDAQFSPDGRWMAYASNETGRSEVWVRAFPGPGGKYPISAGGGVSPVWARDQRELFYLAHEPSGKMGMMMVDIAPGAAFKYSQPHQLFEGDYQDTAPAGSYDITPDGQHFIFVRNEPLPDQRVTKLTVALNWFDELRRRVPASK